MAECPERQPACRPRTQGPSGFPPGAWALKLPFLVGHARCARRVRRSQRRRSHGECEGETVDRGLPLRPDAYRTGANKR
eukprot:scaffold2998_cov390-Prasinococcus_capsulatus_cf.AAC.4